MNNPVWHISAISDSNRRKCFVRPSKQIYGNKNQNFQNGKRQKVNQKAQKVMWFLQLLSAFVGVLGTSPAGFRRWVELDDQESD